MALSPYAKHEAAYRQRMAAADHAEMMGQLSKVIDGTAKYPSGSRLMAISYQRRSAEQSAIARKAMGLEE